MRRPGFGTGGGEEDDKDDDFVKIGTPFDPTAPATSTSIVATLGRKASRLVDLSASTMGYDGKRFHGAFTGGFSAGFYNSVGSVEGWRPSEFVSSRTSRAEKRSFDPEHFMDEGDFGEHGINPKQIKVRNTFEQNSSSSAGPTKTSVSTNNDILRDMIKIKTASIGKKILMTMGWKPGQGVGAHMKRKHRRKLKTSLIQQQNPMNGVKIYGVALPPTLSFFGEENDEEDEENDSYANIPLPPLDYEIHFQPAQKNEHHGIGYKPLESLNLFGHDNLFVQPSVEKQITNVKIRGQAFGVGTEEDEDDKDLYAQDDLKQYDYELTSLNSSDDILRKTTEKNNFTLKFIRYQTPLKPIVYSPPELPKDFNPVHRFKSLSISEQSTPTPNKLDPHVRGLLLGDLSFLSQPPPVVPSKPTSAAPLEWDVEKDRSVNNKEQETSAKSNFLNAVKDRFTSSSTQEHFTKEQSSNAAMEADLKKASSLKLYGDLTRSCIDWKPNPLVCKRWNIPNPYPDSSYDESTVSKKARRQLCSNLFEHLFEPSSNPTEQAQLNEQPLPTSYTQEAIPPKSTGPPPLPFAPIEPFGQEKQERPPLDFFKAVFGTDDDIEQEDTEEEEKNDESIPIPLPITTSSISFDSAKQTDNQFESSSSDDSDIIEVTTSKQDPSISTYYGPVLPSQTSTKQGENTIPLTKLDNNELILTKLLNASAKFEEKRHKKKKKHKK
ncbi:unnamed protein product, partial [Didymodactylos carnosus]